MKKIFNKQCAKKQLTLGEVKAMANKKEVPKVDDGTTVGATATIHENDSEHNEEIFSIIDGIYLGEGEDEVESGFRACMAEVKINQPITMEKLQTRFHYWSSSDSKAMEEDKSCIICHKRKMNWPRYSDHLETAQGID